MTSNRLGSIVLPEGLDDPRQPPDPEIVGDLEHAQPSRHARGMGRVICITESTVAR